MENILLVALMFSGWVTREVWARLWREVLVVCMYV